ncbi:MAG: hypothetical protein ACWGQW_03415 [bacterium]
MDSQLNGYVVLIEWDGKAPPTTWYNRLHDYDLYIRGDGRDDKEESPLARRYSEYRNGVVFQEGAIVVHSQSFAHLLAGYAQQCGAKTVSVGLMTVEQYIMTDDDSHVFERIVAATSKRGPKSKAGAGTYTVTCFEEGHSVEVDLKEPPQVCPICSGFQITWHKGTRKDVAFSNHGNAFEYWKDTRFCTGVFEIPNATFDAKPVKAKGSIDFDFDFELPDEFEVAIKLLDAAWCAKELLGRENTKETIARRSKLLSLYYASGREGDYDIRPGDKVDLVDAASVEPDIMSLM